MLKTVAIKNITIGTRHRKELGDIPALAASIEKQGLLQPIGITENGELVFGYRRIKAYELLGRSEIEAKIVNVTSIVEGERDENELRKDFTVSERVAIGKTIEEKIGERRGRPGHDEKEIRQNFAQFHKGDKTREIAAQKAGFGNAETYREAKKVVNQGTPELVDAVDTGRLSIYTASAIAEESGDEQKNILDLSETQILEKAREIRARKREERNQAEYEAKQALVQQPLPAGRYQTIVIDPPWPVKKILRDIRPHQGGFAYPTMTIEEIKNFPIQALACDSCHLYLWTTHKFLPTAFEIIANWGFQYECLLTWVKNVGFTPFSWMYSTEHVLFCRRGSLALLKKGIRLDFQAKVREHSRKSDEFYALVSQVSPGPRIDIFSREKREDFDQYGNETERFSSKEELSSRQEMV